MAEKKGTPRTPFKLKGTIAKGRVLVHNDSTASMSDTSSHQRILTTAAEVYEKKLLELHPVRLNINMVLAIPPMETAELSGILHDVPGDQISVIARSSEWLPPDVEVVSAEIVSRSAEAGLRVQVRVKNLSATRTVSISNHDVLAEFQLTGGTKLGHTLEALIGPCCESRVRVNGAETTCLVDSGSQVTIISESFYRQYLRDVPLQQIDAVLDITGAGDQNVSYLGVVQTTVQLHREVSGTDKEVETLALVCPDTRISTRVPVIVGTNTMRVLQKHCGQQAGWSWLKTIPIRCEAAFAYKESMTSANGRLCPVRLVGSDVVVQPHSVIDVRGIVRHGLELNRDSVLIQEPTIETLPEGLHVLSGKTAVNTLPRLRVTLVNNTDSPITVKRKQIIADLFAIQAEYALSSVLQDLNSQCEVQNDTQSGERVWCDESRDSSGMKADISELVSRLQFGCDVDLVWKENFTKRLLTFADVFNQKDFDLDKAEVEHDIELIPGAVTRQRPRPIPPQDLEEVRQHIQQLLDANIIRPSTSPFASPIVLVRKRNGSLRMCVDYRKVNARTVRDSYALPKIEDLFRTLTGAKFFSSLDLSKAYYQVPLTERAKKISAFTTPFGLYEFERLPFGLVNAPMTFQRIMDCCFSDMNLAELIIFLDDILIHAATLQELEDRTVKVLERLRKFRLKLDPDKCIFGATEVKHLGYVISEGVIRPDPDKVAAVTSWPKPTTVKEVKSFLGFVGFYRRFIPHFSNKAKPLNDLTVGYVPQKKQSGKKKSGTLTLSSDITALWGKKQDEAFQVLKDELTSDLMLGLADKTRSFSLHCDASGTGLGAVLYQEFDGKLKVIAYASRGLNRTEQNYPAHKREFLALKWAMSEKFHDYLIGSKVTVVTDNNPLCYVLGNAKLDAVSHRWLASLSLYDFDLIYKQGSAHTDADGLSRRPQAPPEEDDEYKETLEKAAFLLEKARKFDGVVPQVVTSEAIASVMFAKGVGVQAHSVRGTAHNAKIWNPEGYDSDDFVPAVETITKDPTAIPSDVLEPEIEGNFATLTLQDWTRLQQQDRCIAAVCEALKRNATLEITGPETKVYSREMKHMVIEEGVLYRRITGDESTRDQIVIPRTLRQKAMKGVHDDLYHTHFDDAIKHARMRFFWPFMATDLQRRIKRCERCTRSGVQTQKAPMSTIMTTYPLELLSIDFLTIEVKGQKQNILVVLDHFTKFAQAILTKDQTAKTVAKALWNEVFMTYGFPSRILSDQGRDFESKLIQELCCLAGIQKCRTTPYHPSGNPVERWNRTLLGMIRSLEQEQKRDWRKHLKSVVHAYNSCIHSSTGFSPYYLFFGRHPRLPIDLAFGIDLGKRQGRSSRQYVEGLKDSLRHAYRMASEQMERSAQKNKVRYDAGSHAATLEVGDRVLVRKLGPRIRSKVDDRWEEGVFVVLEKLEGIPVYVVQRDSGYGPRRTLHRNILLPVGALGWPLPSDQHKALKEYRQRGPRTAEKNLQESESEDEESLFPDLQIKLGLDGNRTLRPEAPEFVPVIPRTEQEEDVLLEPEQDVSQSGSQEEAGDVELPMEVTSGASTDRPEDGPENSDDDKEGVKVPAEDGAVHTSASESDEVEPHEGSTEDDLEVSGQQRQELRRSSRRRRPVERLNLMHRCVCRESVDLEKLGDIHRKMQGLLDFGHVIPPPSLLRYVVWAISELSGELEKCWKMNSKSS